MLPVLKHIPAKRLAEETGLAVSTIKAARNGHTNPHGPNRKKFVQAAATFAREQQGILRVGAPSDSLAACANYLALLAGDPCPGE